MQRPSARPVYFEAKNPRDLFGRNDIVNEMRRIVRTAINISDGSSPGFDYLSKNQEGQGEVRISERRSEGDEKGLIGNVNHTVYCLEIIASENNIPLSIEFHIPNNNNYGAKVLYQGKRVESEESSYPNLRRIVTKLGRSLQRACQRRNWKLERISHDDRRQFSEVLTAFQ